MAGFTQNGQGICLLAFEPQEPRFGEPCDGQDIKSFQSLIERHRDELAGDTPPMPDGEVVDASYRVIDDE